MARKLYSLARMDSATTGTGTITLGSPVTGFLSFAGAGVSNAEVVYYGIRDGANSEVGYGTYTTSGTTLTRTVLKSTNSDAAISLSGSQEVFITGPKEAFSIGKQTVWVPARAMIARTTNGPASGTVEMTTNKNMFSTLDFDTTTQEFAQFSIRMPKSWDLGTVSFVPVWSHPVTTVNFGVVFGMSGVAISDDDAGDVAFGTAQTSTDTGGTTNDIYQGPESSAITIAGTPTAKDLVMYRVNRTVADAGDTMAVDARLHGVILLYTVDVATDD